MIKIFQQTDTDFTSNGDVVVRPLKAKIHKEDNGSFYFLLEAGLEYVDYIVEDNIIVVDTPQGAQAFRITNPQKTRYKISVKANHVFYDSKNYLVIDENNADLSVDIVQQTCSQALTIVNTQAQPTSPFLVSSDITTQNSLLIEKKSLYESILAILNTWGGHIVRNNWTVQILSSIGIDNGVTVRYRKNLKDITCVENWDNVVTKLLPVGRDNILLNAVDSTKSIFLVSDVQYDIPYTKTVTFSQDEINQEDYASEQQYKQALVQDLETKATLYLNENKYPKINYTIKTNLDNITDVGDLVEVIDERLNVDFFKRVIAFDYDCLLKKYVEVEVGDFKQTLSDLLPSISTNVSTTVTGSVKNFADYIQETLSGSYVIFEGNQILVVDALPKTNAQNVMKINSQGISFSSNGINGTFKVAWSLADVLNFQNISVINLTLSQLAGGTLKIGGASNANGVIEIYDNSNTKIGQIDNQGITLNNADFSKNVITRSILTSATSLTTSSYTPVPFNQTNVVGSKLVAAGASSYGVRVTALSKVLVSCTVTFNGHNVDAEREIIIYKNSVGTIIEIARATFSATNTLSIASFMISINTNDILYCGYYTTNSTDSITSAKFTVEGVG